MNIPPCSTYSLTIARSPTVKRRAGAMEMNNPAFSSRSAVNCGNINGKITVAHEIQR